LTAPPNNPAGNRRSRQEVRLLEAAIESWILIHPDVDQMPRTSELPDALGAGYLDADYESAQQALRALEIRGVLAEPVGGQGSAIIGRHLLAPAQVEARRPRRPRRTAGEITKVGAVADALRTEIRADPDRFPRGAGLGETVKEIALRLSVKLGTKITATTVSNAIAYLRDEGVLAKEKAQRKPPVIAGGPKVLTQVEATAAMLEHVKSVGPDVRLSRTTLVAELGITRMQLEIACTSLAVRGWLERTSGRYTYWSTAARLPET
jgi:hypothetical protein